MNALELISPATGSSSLSAPREADAGTVFGHEFRQQLKESLAQEGASASETPAPEQEGAVMTHLQPEIAPVVPELLIEEMGKPVSAELAAFLTALGLESAAPAAQPSEKPVSEQLTESGGPAETEVLETQVAVVAGMAEGTVVNQTVFMTASQDEGLMTAVNATPVASASIALQGEVTKVTLPETPVLQNQAQPAEAQSESKMPSKPPVMASEAANVVVKAQLPTSAGPAQTLVSELMVEMFQADVTEQAVGADQSGSEQGQLSDSPELPVGVVAAAKSSQHQVQSRLPEAIAAPTLSHAEVESRLQVIKQVSDQIRVLHLQNQREIQLHLQPESLGQVSIRLIEQKGLMQLHILAEQPLTKDMLEANLGQLRQSLSSQGVQLQQVLVELQQQPLDQNGHQQQRQPQEQPQSQAEDSLMTFEQQLAESSSQPIYSGSLSGHPANSKESQS